MPAPRADFRCIGCEEEFELPVAARACPCCGGLLERRWTAHVTAKPRVHQIEHLLESMPRKPEVPRDMETRPQTAPRALPRMGISAEQAIAMGKGLPPVLDTRGSPGPIPLERSGPDGASRPRMLRAPIPGLSIRPPRVVPGPQSLVDGETMKRRKDRQG